MQLIVHFFETYVIDIPSVFCEYNGMSIKESISERSGIPSTFISMRINGKNFDDHDTLKSPNSIIRCSLAGGLPGGKGGFGAALRAAAKQKGPKRTTDFGACRDLSGRRLRQVNDEILLQKWKDAQDNNEKFDAEGSTQSGINMWYLRTPNWADPFKESYRKKYMKNRRKTAICIDWQKARENGRNAPANAPIHWGCPRGPRCEYAHGEEELQGNSSVTLAEKKRLEKEAEESLKRDAYIYGNESLLDLEMKMSDAVSTGLGLQANKRRKIADGECEQITGSSSTSINSSITSNKDNAKVQESANPIIQPIPINISPYVSSAIVTNTEDIPDNSNTDVSSAIGKLFINSKLCNVTDNSISYEQELCASLTCTEKTSNVGPKGDIIGDDPQMAVGMLHAVGTGLCVDFEQIALAKDIVDPFNGSIYYEVDLKSGGLMQIGWGTAECEVIQYILNKDKHNGRYNNMDVDVGIGDDCFSFGYDGWRQRKWHKPNAILESTCDGDAKNGDSDELGEVYGDGITWNVGDTVGCLLSYQYYTSSNSTKSEASLEKLGTYSLSIKYYLNDIDLGYAFTVPNIRTLTSTGRLPKLYPAVSLDLSESCQLNFGQNLSVFKNKWNDIVAHLNDIQEHLNGSIVYSKAGHSGEMNLITVWSLRNVSKLIQNQEAKEMVAAPIVYPPIPGFDTDKENKLYPTSESLEQFGLEHLKHELMNRKLKCGGTLEQRAARLFAVKNLDVDKIPKKYKA